jgi:hypothetical protein
LGQDERLDLILDVKSGSLGRKKLFMIN